MPPKSKEQKLIETLQSYYKLPEYSGCGILTFQVSSVQPLLIKSFSQRDLKLPMQSFGLSTIQEKVAKNEKKISKTNN